MAQTECYAMVRGSAIRVTGLTPTGVIPDPIQYAVSKAVAKVQINEVVESGSNEMLGSDENDDDKRIRLVRADETIRYTVDIDFLRVDPGVLSLVTGVPLVRNDLGIGFGQGIFGQDVFGSEVSEAGFGGDSFGEDGFGQDGDVAVPINLEVIGFDYETRRPPVAFALEVWSRLAGNACTTSDTGFDQAGFDEGSFGGGGSGGGRQYGYTVFPFLKGGYLSGFSFENGLVSFNLRSAQTRRAPKWGVGPYDLDGTHERLPQPVSRNTMYRQMLTSAPPPAQADGVQETTDVIVGGTATVTSEDSISGGRAASMDPWIVEGGRAV